VKAVGADGARHGRNPPPTTTFAHRASPRAARSQRMTLYLQEAYPGIVGGAGGFWGCKIGTYPDNAFSGRLA